MSEQWQLAQLNIGTLLHPADSPELAEFTANLDRINGLAESSPGFVWRLKDETGNAMAIRHPDDELFGDDKLVNLSVWRDLSSLRDFVFSSDHASFLRRRNEWFERSEQVYLVLWWVPAGHQPGLEEAGQRLRMLMEQGPGPEAFSFRKNFDPPA